MGHLTTDQLIDLAEGARAASSAPHLQACAECRGQLADLRATLSIVAAVEAPEPSPLFWDRLSSRVREAVAAEPDRPSMFAWMRTRPAAIGAIAGAVAAVVLFVQAGRPPFDSTPAPAGVVAAGDPALDLTAPDDDPSLSLVSDLAADLDFAAAREVGLITHAGADEDAINQLTAGERRELRQLLQGELSGGGRRGA